MSNIIDLSTIDRTKLGQKVADALIALSASIGALPITTTPGTGTGGSGTGTTPVDPGTGSGSGSGSGTGTPPVTGTAKSGLFPLNTAYMYELDNPGDRNVITQGLIQLFDSTGASPATSDPGLTTSVHWGYGKLLPTDQYYIDLLPVTQAGLTINQVKLFYNTGSSNSGYPWHLYAWNNGTLTLLAQPAGGTYNGWTTFTIPNVLAQRLYISQNKDNTVTPTELQVYGTWTTKTPVLYPPKPPTFDHMCGINGFIWDILDNNTQQVLTARKAALSAGYSMMRLYQEWNLMEQTQGKYSFSPCWSGSWDLDGFLAALKSAGVTTLFDLHDQPVWMQTGYGSAANNENIPMPFGSDPSLPASYIAQARMAFQIAARYGATKVATNLLSVDPTLRWNGDTANVVKTGLNTLTYLECDNERDKWWKGTNAYQTGYQYAANLSAFYDGHKNTMGAGVGVKNADPNMQVVIGGTASPVPDYFRAIIDWSIDNRGLNSDGTPNLPFDVINFHAYAGAAQSGGTVACPEIYGFDKIIAPIVQVGLEYNKEVWWTETGYDTQPGSPIAVPAIGSKTVLQVQADWILRTALISARSGVNRLCFYMIDDDAPGSSTEFETSGLLDPSQSDGLKPASRYLAQARVILSGYTFASSSILSSGAIQDTYTSPSASPIKVVFLPTQVGATATMVLTNQTVWHLSSVNTTITKLTGQTTVQITETPVFIQ